MADANTYTDVFGSALQFGGSWKLDGAILTFTTGGSFGGDTVGVNNDGTTKITKGTVKQGKLTYELVVQDVQFTYKRPVNRLLSLTSAKQYMVTGRGMGQLQISSIMGKKDDMYLFIQTFSNPCNVGSNIISLKACDNACPVQAEAGEEASKGKPQIFNLLYVLLDSIAAQVQVGELSYVTETITGVFGGLNLETEIKN